uniref:Uncharacterized protein n=1 Tax=Haptolina ericina TaxID=156174 RepID=A0A7S3BQY5_9EUKA
MLSALLCMARGAARRKHSISGGECSDCHLSLLCCGCTAFQLFDQEGIAAADYTLTRSFAIDGRATANAPAATRDTRAPGVSVDTALATQDTHEMPELVVVRPSSGSISTRPNAKLPYRC